MSYLLEILGRGLLGELSQAFEDRLADDPRDSTAELRARSAAQPDAVAERFRLGVRLLRERHHAEARDVLMDVLRLEPNHQPARIGLACVLHELGLTRDAASELRRILQSTPDDGAVLFALGFCQERLGDLPSAALSYGACLNASPRIRNAHERLAAIAWKDHDLSGAVNHYEILASSLPEDSVIQLTLANLYARAGRHGDAIRLFEFVLATDPDQSSSRDDLVAVCVKAGQYEKAILLLGEMIEREPQRAEHRLRLGDACRAASLHDQAIASYEQALLLAPDSLESSLKLGTSHLRRGDLPQAAEAFGRASEINDRTVTALVGLCVVHDAEGRPDRARTCLEAASGLEPNSTELFAEIAGLHLQLLVSDQVRNYLAPAVLANDPKSTADPRLAILVNRQVDNLLAALEQYPNHADLHYRLGLLLRYRGDHRWSLDAFQRALTINPHYFKALVKLGFTYRDLGNEEQAIAMFHRALDIEPEAIDLHYQLGLIFTHRREFAEAVRQFELVQSRRPGHLDSLANLALCLEDMGLTDRATTSWRTLCDAIGDGGALRLFMDDIEARESLRASRFR